MNDPLLTIRATRNVSFTVYFNSTDAPGVLPGQSCAAAYPDWADIGWNHVTNALTIVNTPNPDQNRFFTGRQRFFNAGDIIELGPNDIPGCPTGFVPLMYFAQIFG